MKNKKLLVMLGLAGFIVLGAKPFMHGSGQAGSTGSPGEGTCADCHSPAASGSVVITSDIPNWQYALGQTYHITVTVSEVGANLFGLSAEVLKNNGNTDAGTLKITKSAETQLMTGNGRSNVTHVQNGGLVTTAGSKAFTFDWTAPATDDKDVTIYVSSVAGPADADMGTKNTYTTKKVVNSPTTNIGAGIVDISTKTNFSVFPNPVKNTMNITVNNTNGTAKAALYSITGEKVADLFNENVQSGVVKNIPVAATWAKGIYFLQITDNEKSSIQKIVIE